MAEPGHNSGQDPYAVTADELRQFIERFEQLEAEKKEVSEQQKELMAEAKGRGYSTKIMRRIIALRKRRPVHEMPHHIAGKRSWSPTYKAMVFAREEAIMQAYLDKVRQDRGFLDKAIEHVFGGDDTDDPA